MSSKYYKDSVKGGKGSKKNSLGLKARCSPRNLKKKKSGRNFLNVSKKYIFYKSSAKKTYVWNCLAKDIS